MALTKISTGGVKDDAASQAKIADEAVDEARLQVSNAGTNGQFLQKQSGNTGGLTWATVDSTPEGTVIKSTGESGTSKFLRVDGDGSCSWQVPPDTNTQLTLHDEDNFASNSATAAASQQSIKAYVDTQVGAISAAPEITATASGTIAADKSVYVKSDGTVAQVSQIAAGFNGSEYQFDTGLATDRGVNWKAMAYDTTNKVMVLVYRDRGNSNKFTAVAGTVTGSVITWGTPVAHTNGDACTEVGICWDSWSGNFVAVYRDTGSTRGRVCVIGVSGTTVSFPGQTNNINGNGNMSWMSIAAFPQGQRCLVVYRDHEDNWKLKSRVISGHSGSSPNPVTGSPTEVQGANCVGLRLIYDPDSNRGVLVYSITSDSYKGYVRVCICGSNAASWGNAQEFSSYGLSTGDSDQQGGISLAYSTGAQRCLVLFHVTDGDSDQIVGGRVFSVNTNSTVTFSGNLFWAIDGCDVDDVQLSASTNSGSDSQLLVAYSDWEDDKKGKARLITLSNNGATVSVGSAETFNSSVTSSMSTQNIAVVFNKDADSHVVVYTDNGDSDKGKGIVRTETSTDMTPENFIGFSSAGYSNGNTATIKVVGNTSTQSSLTPGQKYYVQQNGTLGLTPDSPNVEAGIALSSTKLLIKG